MSTTPAVPAAGSADPDRRPTGPVTLRPPGAAASDWFGVFFGVLYLGMVWAAAPDRYRRWLVGLAIVLIAAQLARLVGRPDRTRLSPAGITAGRRLVAWSSVLSIDAGDGRFARFVRLRVAGRSRPIVLPAPFLSRGLRERPRGAGRFDLAVAEIEQWATAYAPQATFTVRPSTGATAWPLALPLLAIVPILLLLAWAASFFL